MSSCCRAMAAACGLISICIADHWRWIPSLQKPTHDLPFCCTNECRCTVQYAQRSWVRRHVGVPKGKDTCSVRWPIHDPVDGAHQNDVHRHIRVTVVEHPADRCNVVVRVDIPALVEDIDRMVHGDDICSCVSYFNRRVIALHINGVHGRVHCTHSNWSHAACILFGHDDLRRTLRN